MTRCATDTGTSHKGSYNPVLSKSVILYTNNSMQDNVSSLDRIPVVTCVCKLLYAVLTNTSIFPLIIAARMAIRSLTLYG
jgi:hypothetical protein